MNKENLFEAFGEIDDDFLRENEQKKRPHIKMKATVVFAAAAILVLGISAAAAGGHFKNIKNIFGTVTGTEYLDATEEITVKFLGMNGAEPVVEFVLNAPNKPPYSTGGTLSLGEYEIRDSEGNVVSSSKKPRTLPEGRYIIKVSSLIMSAKAEQDMTVYGEWEGEVEG